MRVIAMVVLTVALVAPAWAGLTVSERAAIVGSYGAEVEGDGTGDPFEIHIDHGAGAVELEIQWLFRARDLTLVAGGSTDVVLIRDLAGDPVFAVGIQAGVSGLEVTARVRAVDGFRELAPVGVSGVDVVKVRAEWRRGASDGFLKVLIDDVLAASLEGLEVAAVPEILYFGAPTDSIAYEAGYLALDEFVLTGSMAESVAIAEFWGMATDLEDGDVSASLEWSSSVDGVLGSGAGPFLAPLTVGEHLITAGAIDGEGQRGSSTHSVSVVLVDGAPVVTIFRPAEGAVIGGE